MSEARCTAASARETSKSIRAVEATAGIVVAWGSPGQERIFKSYFSSCCGGKTQSAYDAFGDEYIPPLAEHDRGATCSISPKFNWAPVTIKKDELSRGEWRPGRNARPNNRGRPGRN